MMRNILMKWQCSFHHHNQWQCGKWWWTLLKHEIVRYSFWQTQVPEDKGTLGKINPAKWVFYLNTWEICWFQILVLLSIPTFGMTISDNTFCWGEHQMMLRDRSVVQKMLLVLPQHSRLELGWSRSQVGCSFLGCLQEVKTGVYHAQKVCSNVAVWHDALPRSSEVSWIPGFLGQDPRI